MANEKKNATGTVATNEKDGSNVRVVKVQPYPIPCNLAKPNTTVIRSCKIVRLEEYGFMFKAAGYYFRLLEEYNAEFEIPGLKLKISEPIRIIKTYETAEAYSTQGGVERVVTVEAHFKKKKGDFQKHIKSFLLKIGQTNSSTLKVEE